MRAKLLSWWQFIKSHRITIQFITIFLAIAIILILIGYLFNWTGFNAYSIIWLPTATKGTALPITKLEEQQPAKTLWDWLQLIFVPAILTLGAVWFTARQNHDREIAQQQMQNDREMAEKRYQRDRDFALDNQREAVLQTYLDKMSELLLHEKLLESEEGDEVRIIAQVRTMIVLPNLDGKRKGNVLQFLHDAGLIYYNPPPSQQGVEHKDMTIISLMDADLSGADLNSARLNEVNLDRANLRDANLSNADLTGANFNLAYLNDTDCRNARLGFTKLSLADLSGADLREAYVRGAELIGTNLNGADLRGADLREAVITDEQWEKAKSYEGMIISAP